MNRAEVAAIIDHTLLKPEATPQQVQALIGEAAELGTYSVCVSPNQLPIQPSGGVLVATVCGFPSGAHHSTIKAAEAADAVQRGADEVDMVINLSLAASFDFDAVEADIRAVRDACPAPVVLKVIIESAALTDEQIVGCCRAAEAAGADFVKTSTGFHPAGGASVHAVSLMAQTVGGRLGVKASGGIRTAKDALAMIDAGATRLGLSASAAILAEIPGVSDGDLLARARDWSAHDPDETTRAELDRLIEQVESGAEDAAEAAADLADRFAGPLTFGTAGLRGEVAAGESRMNVAVVTRATAGVAQYLADTVGPGARVVVGCDARYGSHAFYDAAVQVLTAAGAHVLALPRERPTPLTAYAVRALDADAGIMITASHNPPADNGYKVYLGGRAVSGDEANGVQIVPPADAEIAARIAAAPSADQVRRSTDGIEWLGQDVIDAYVARAASHRRATAPSQITLVLTAMHGVGAETALAVLAEAGISRVHRVSAQIDPDPDFPTVPFPNPEEPGAIDLSIDLAREVGADLVVALDPDADRCSLAIPLSDGTWRQLSGDEIGAVLGEQAAANSEREGDTLACSIVSSRLLSRIAEHHGLRAASTLTGFKWIARAPGLRFGYEEAIGYCTDPQAVRDKDGIGAMSYAVSLVEELAEQGKTIEDLLDDLALTHGLHATTPLTFRVTDLSMITDSMAKLREVGIAELAGSPVIDTVDLAEGADGLPPTDGLRYLTEASDRVIIRPSGTEPKLKCYLEVILPCENGQVPHAAAAGRLEQIKSDLRTVLDI